MTDSIGRADAGVEEWPEGWVRFATEDEGQGFVNELTAGVGSGHPLFGVPMVCIASAEGYDDYLFKSKPELSNDDVVYAEVHLTWRGHTELAGYPTTRLFDSFNEWVASQTITEDEQAALYQSAEKQRRSQQRRRVVGLWGYWLVVALGILALSVIILHFIVPEGFGL